MLALVLLLVLPNPWHIHNTEGLDITNPVPVVWTTPGVPVPPPSQPAVGSPFYWVLSEAANVTGAAPGQVWDIDGNLNSAATVATLHSHGAYVICYVDAGTYEPGRPDSSQLQPYATKGPVVGWPGEVWLDVSQPGLESIMRARFQACKDKGFDAIEPDNIDGYTNVNGISAAQQLAYNKNLAQWAHAIGMGIGLKNDIDQVPQLVTSFDWMLDEQCYEFSECATLKPFADAGKAVFIAEYKAVSSASCQNAVTNHYVVTRYNLDLTNAGRVPCP